MIYFAYILLRKEYKIEESIETCIVLCFYSSATIYNNMRKPVTNSSNYFANPHEMGVGEINPIKALNPGLVFETGV